MVFLREGLCPGLSEEMIEALRSKDIRTVEDLVSSDTEELAQTCSMSYKALVAVRRVLLAQHTAFPVSGADLYDELLSSTAILSTGNASLDKLLDTGLYTGELTELAGCPGSGKTQVCFGVAANLSCELKQRVLFIDTSGGLSATRLLQMIKAKTSSMEEQMEALQRIQVAQAFDVFSLLECLHNLRSGGFQQVSAGGGVLKAVIVDSVTAVLSHILGGKQSEGMSLMIQVAGELRTIAKDLNVAVLVRITNITMFVAELSSLTDSTKMLSYFKKMMTLFGQVTNHVTKDGNGILKAGLGLSWSHVPRTRILLKRVEKPSPACCSLRTATLVKSSRQPCHLTQEIDLKSWGETEDELPGPSGKRKLMDEDPREA